MATELKKKRQFKIVHVLLGIIAVAVLIFLYVFVIAPVNEYRILSSKVIEDTNEYIAALSEQDYERAADYIEIYEKVIDYNSITTIEGNREEWIERMEQLERSGITIQGVQNVRTSDKDNCMRKVNFEVVIDVDGTPATFYKSANPKALLPSGHMVKCPSSDNYASLDILYGITAKSDPEIEQAKLAISSELVRE